MKIKFDVGVGKAVISYKNDNATIVRLVFFKDGDINARIQNS